jgi:hypothetical protein
LWLVAALVVTVTQIMAEAEVEVVGTELLPVLL